MRERVELSIVGAGPAGMQAAITAADAGVSVVLVDRYPRPGGQYLQQLPAGFLAAAPTRRDLQARSVLDRLQSPRLRLLSNTVVWGALPTPDSERWELALHGPGAPHRVDSQAIILAPGAYDRPVPFPGWTLPGVMTAGGAQTLVKTQRVLPGRRILLSGTGPLQLAVAASLVQAGATVIGVLEASPLGWDAFAQAVAAWGQWTRLREGMSYWWVLRSAHVPFQVGWSVVEARGDGEVEEAVIARLDKEWRPIPGTARTVAVDTIITGYGLIPSTEVSRLLGCEHSFQPEQGGYVPCRDVEMQTSMPGVYAVGDGAGIGGAELAMVEGQIAALAASRRLGHLGDDVAQRMIGKLQRRLAREGRFARMLQRLFTPGPGLFELATDDTVICRCEEVTLGEIRRAGAEVQSVNELKGLTRVGMGDCQGRICGELAARFLAVGSGSGKDFLTRMGEVGTFTARPPTYPLTVSELADAVLSAN